MIIPTRFGGLEFSTYADLGAIRATASRLVVAAVTVMVPNSLEPHTLFEGALQTELISPVDLPVQCGQPLLLRRDLSPGVIDQVVLGCAMSGTQHLMTAVKFIAACGLTCVHSGTKLYAQDYPY